MQAYIFDIVTGAAVASLARGTRPQVTVTLDVTFEHPAYDAPLTFEARVLSGGRQISFVDAVCTDTNGEVCSRARAYLTVASSAASSRPTIVARAE